MQIKPKILQGWKPKIAYITGMENTINPKNLLLNLQPIGVSEKISIVDILDDFLWQRFGEDSYERIDNCLTASKKQLNEFNQPVNPGDIRRVKYARYKRKTLYDGRISFNWVDLTNNDDIRSMFWEHNMFQWFVMRITLLRSTEDIINSLIPPEDHH